ncbi:MAG: S1/P1 nuclease [Gammaproteobacteria bacterium]|nr:S1/P1 nuclease [Gammaproteobacteria bacterium]
MPALKLISSGACRVGLTPAAGASAERWLFALAATWPDYARGFAREPSSEVREQLMAQFNFPRWHYVNLPTLLVPDAKWQRALAPDLGATVDGDRRVLNIVQALELQLATLSSAHTTPAQQAIALCWLLHLVGDLHQPLHTTALFARGRLERGDRGGNDLVLADRRNLHAVWDAALGTTRARRKVDAVVKEIRAAAPLGHWQGADFAGWAKAGQLIARDEVYSTALRTSLLNRTLPDYGLLHVALEPDYETRAGAIARDQATLAAMRLRELLNRVTQSP